MKFGALILIAAKTAWSRDFTFFAGEILSQFPRDLVYRFIRAVDPNGRARKPFSAVHRPPACTKKKTSQCHILHGVGKRCVDSPVVREELLNSIDCVNAAARDCSTSRNDQECRIGCLECTPGRNGCRNCCRTFLAQYFSLTNASAIPPRSK